jgi:hypothetical protein
MKALFHGYFGRDGVENRTLDVHLSWLPWRLPLVQDNSLLRRVVHRCGHYNWLHSSELAKHGVGIEAARWRCVERVAIGISKCIYR